jgi:hypothetical protein
MFMDYFLMGREGWGLSEQEFIQHLTSRWPSASLRSVDIPGGSRSVDFRIPMAESLLDGHFNLEGSTVVYYGAVRDCAEFALWYQATLPKGRPFLLFDEGYTHSVELRTDTTVEDIISVLHGAPRT